MSVSSCNAILGFEEGTERAAGGAAAGGAASAGGNGAGSTGTESCLDSVDNDGDGAVDCDDPDCQPDFMCIPPVTSSWLGVGWVSQGADVPSCRGDLALDLFDDADLVIPSASCACACATPSDETCAAVLQCGSSCQGAPMIGATVVMDCTDWEVTSTYPYCWAKDLRPMSGTCTPSAQLADDSITWEATAQACIGFQGGHCSTGGRCVPRPPTGAEGPCLVAEGSKSCPSSHPRRREYWDGEIDDGRSCDGSACTCGAASEPTCTCQTGGCSVEVHQLDGTCSSTSPELASLDEDACADLVGTSGSPPYSLGVRLANVAITTPGQCAPSGSASLDGSVQPKRELTVCCVEASGQ